MKKKKKARSERVTAEEQPRSKESLLKQGQEKGFLTYDEVNKSMPEELTPEQMEEWLAVFSEAGIELVDRASDAKIDFDKILDPDAYIGRAARQVDEFIRGIVEPIRKKYRKELNRQAELNV